MTKTLPKWFGRSIVLALLLLPWQLLARDFTYPYEDQTLTYTVLSEEERTVSVSQGSNSYSGDVVIPSIAKDGDTEYTVTEIGKNAFYQCGSLTSVEFPTSLTSIGYHAFEGCTGLSSIKIPDSVTKIDYSAFYYCINLSVAEFASIESVCAIEFLDRYANPLTYAHSLFIDGKLIKELVIPETVTEIGANAFCGASCLTSIEIPNSVTKIGDSAFYECTNLVKAEYASIEALCSIEFKWGGNPLFGSSPVFGGSEDRTGELYINGKEIKRLIIPESVTKIGAHTFVGSGITSVEIPNSVTSIGESAFNRCSDLPSVEIPNSVTSIGGYAFSGCSGLTSIKIPNSVTSIGEGAFEDCSSLPTIELPNSIISIEDFTFQNCYSLTSLEIPNSVISIGHAAFWGCSGLTSITIPSTVTSINNMSFYICSSLREVTIEDSETPLTITAVAPNKSVVAFERCPLEKIYIGRDVSAAPCISQSKLTSVTFGNSVTSIPPNAFNSCSSLPTIELPTSLTSIGEKAFYDCSSLTSVYYGAEDPISGDKSIFSSTSTDSDVIYNNATLYVPESAIEKSKEIEPWKNFAKIEAYDFANTDKVLARSISLDKEAENLKVGETITLTATVLPENTADKSVTWSSSDEAVATVDAEGNVSALQLGTAIITAKTANGLEATCTLTVVAETRPTSGIELNLPETELTAGATVQLTATVNSEDATGKTIIWTSSDEAVATVDAEGVVTAVAPGTVTITASIEGTELSATCSVTVNPASVIEPESIELNLPEMELIAGSSVQLTATVLPENATDKTVTWTSSDEAVATVDAEGNVSALQVGTAVITAKTANGLEATCTIIVVAETRPTNGIELNLPETELTAGATVQLTATVNSEDAEGKTIIWTSSDEAVATVDAEGMVTAVAPGTVTITASIEGTELLATCSVTVNPSPVIEPESIELNLPETELIAGASVQLTATVLPEDATDKTVTWTSSDEAVATVDAEGNVSALQAGTAVITAKTANGLEATCTITVEYADRFDYTYGGQTLSYKVTSIAGKTVSVTGCGAEVDVKIPEKVIYNGVEYTVTAIEPYAFEYSSLTSVEIPNSITSIGNGAFKNSSSLTSVEIPNSVTSIGDNTFEGCSSLTSVEIPNSVTSIGEFAFAYCSSLTSVEIPNSVTSIGREAFFYCTSLQSVVMSNSVTSIEANTFYGCRSLTSIEIPNSVTLIGQGAFSGCGLTSVDIPNSVTSIEDYAFYGCNNLENVVLPSSVESVGRNAFSGANLLSVVIFNPDIIFGEEVFGQSGFTVVCPEGVTGDFMDHAKVIHFNPEGASMTEDGMLLTNNGKVLTYITPQHSLDIVIPEGVEVIASEAFCDVLGMLKGVKEIESLTIPGSLKEIEADAFRDVDIKRVNFTDWPAWYTEVKLGNFYSNPYWNSEPYVGGVRFTTPELKEGMTEIPDYKNYNLYFKDEVDLPTTIKRIGSYAFYNNKELYSVILPVGLEEIGECAFAGCSLLENPSFPAGLKKIEDGAYSGCTSITEITLPAGLTYLGEMTPSIELPNPVYSTGSPIDQWNDPASVGVFSYCTALEKAVLVADIDYLGGSIFRGCPLQTVFLPLQLKKIGDSAFYNTGLDEITFPATLESIGDYAFADNTSYMGDTSPAITTLVIPNSVTSLGKYAFEGQRISNLTIGSGLKTIPEGAFKRNYLEILNLSEGLEEICGEAFAENYSLENQSGISAVNLPSTLKVLGENAFGYTSICEMIIPDGVMSLPSGSCGSPSILTVGSGVKEIASDAFSFEKLYTFRLKAHTPPAIAPDAFPVTEVINDHLTLIVNKDRSPYYLTNARWKQIVNIIEEGQSEVVIHMTGQYAISTEIRLTSGLMPASVTKMTVDGPLTANDLVIIKENMPALTSLDITGVKGVTAIPESQFYGSMLADIVLPDNLESIGSNAFANCGLLQIPKLPATLKSIGDNAFSGSPRVNITELPAGLETIGNSAFSSTGLTRIVANEALTQIGSGAFSGCDQLEVADFGASSIESIPYSAFADCYELDEVILPETVKEIGSYAFSNTALRNIDFVTGVSSIGANAFSNNRRLVAATLPKSVKVVDTGLFSNCPRLLTVSMPSATASVGTSVMEGDRKLSNISCAANVAPQATSSSFTGVRTRYVSLIVPTLSYQSYLDAPGWGGFQTIQNRIPVEMDEGIDASIVAEDEYQQMLEEDKLEAEEDAAAQEPAPSPAVQTAGSGVPRSMISAMPRAVRRAAARVATTQYFASLFDGAQVQTGAENTAMRVFIHPKDDVKITSIRFGEEELLPYYEEHNSILLPAGVSKNLRILTDAKPEPVSIKLDKSEETIGEGQTLQLTATVTGPDSADKTVAWSSSDENVATVDKTGLVTGVAAGTATITAKLANGMEATCKITVEANVIAAEGISLNLPEAEMTEGSTLTLIATVNPETTTDKTVTWTSSDEAVTTVDSEGNVTALQIGTATITARTVNGFEATCQITVVANVIAAEGISLNLPEAEMTEGSTMQLIATVDPDTTTDKTVTWTSSDESVATVDSDGNVTALKIGTATITARTVNGFEATCQITVVANVIAAESISLNKTEETIAEEETVQLIATILPEDATEQTVTWSSSDESVATVDETGLVKGVKAGTATITATSSNGLTATCAVVVEAKPSAIEGVEGDGQVSVRVENGEIVVEAPADAEVDVFAITGTLVRHTRDHRIAGLTRGVYIVRVAGKSFKVSL